MSLRSAASPRRWQVAIAIAAALGVFTAVTTGWALRTAHGIAAPPQPAAWSHAARAAGAKVAHAQPVYGSPSTMHHGMPTLASLHSSLPGNHKPTKNAWMTRDRPPTWARVAPQLVWSPRPALFAAALPLPGTARSRAPAAVLAVQDILTRFCVARR